MEIIKSYTGVWYSPVFMEYKQEIKETISIILCDRLYIVMRITETVDSYDGIPIETKYTKSYGEALNWYEEWNKHLMWNMTNT